MVISKQCFALVDKLRSFRHRERNTYGFNLDFPISVERAREAVESFALFRTKIRAFFKRNAQNQPK